ncbi:hypothetical protein OSTOST_10324 [Ostertagia ostertagi]
MFGNMLITVNRFSALCLKDKYEKINRCTYVGASLLYALVSLILNVRLMIELHKLLKISDFGRHSRHEKYYWINDVMVSIPPLSLLMFNGELRKDIVNFICCRRHQQWDNISVSIFENRQSVSGLNKDSDRRNATRSVY